MKTKQRLDFKRLLLIFVPATIILASAGTLAAPGLEEIEEIKRQEAESLARILEATKVAPLLERFESSKGASLATVESWLNKSVPKTENPRIFLADIRLSELRSGVKMTSCQQHSDDVLDDVLSEDEIAKQTGSSWELRATGDFAAITRFIELLQHGDRLYIVDGFELKRGSKGKLNTKIRLYVPGLTPESNKEESNQ